MEEIKDYVFYTILKDFRGNKYNDTGISYGVKKGNSNDHETYFRAFLNIDYFPWEGLNLSSSWPISLEIMSADGNVMIANSAPEVEKMSQRTYVIYLPDEPSMFQVLFLERISEELNNAALDVGIYGKYKEDFLKRRLDPNFNAHEFLNKYIAYYKNKLEETKLTMKKVLP